MSDLEPGEASPERAWYRKRWAQVLAGIIALIIVLGIIGSATSKPKKTSQTIPPPITSLSVAVPATTDTAPTTTSVPTPVTTAPTTPPTTAASPATTQAPPPPAAATTPAPAQGQTVTPGAYCADSQAGQTAYSAAGNEYRCSLYSNGRYRWKRI